MPWKTTAIFLAAHSNAPDNHTKFSGYRGRNAAGLRGLAGFGENHARGEDAGCWCNTRPWFGPAAEFLWQCWPYYGYFVFGGRASQSYSTMPCPMEASAGWIESAAPSRYWLCAENLPGLIVPSSLFRSERLHGCPLHGERP